MDIRTFKSLINRITKTKKLLKLAICKNFLKKRFQPKKMVDKCILVVHAKEPFCTLVENQIFIIFNFPLYCRSILIVGTYLQNVAFILLILGIKKL
jgi:hypothetical protein